MSVTITESGPYVRVQFHGVQAKGLAPQQVTDTLVQLIVDIQEAIGTLVRKHNELAKRVDELDRDLG